MPTIFGLQICFVTMWPAKSLCPIFLCSFALLSCCQFLLSNFVSNFCYQILCHTTCLLSWKAWKWEIVWTIQQLSCWKHILMNYCIKAVTTVKTNIDRNKYGSHPHSYELYLSSSKNKAWKKIEKNKVVCVRSIS